MLPDDFQILNAAFENALSLSGAEQTEFLQRFRQSYPELADRLERLIKSDASAQDLLQSWVNRNIQDLTKDQETPWIGEDIDKWRVIKHLGSGGMGAVFLAERICPDGSSQGACSTITSSRS